MSEKASATRTDRRNRTEATILQAARETFAQHGYHKATIRAVADRAGCDPALVMKYFGNKNGLLRAATALNIDIAGAYAGPESTRPERVLRYTFEQFDAQADSVASTLRSMLTHDESAEEALQLFNAPIHQPPSSELPDDPHAALREDLLLALSLGTCIIRSVLKTPAVQSATIEELLTVLLPAAQQLQARETAPTAGPDPRRHHPGDTGELSQISEAPGG
jgi:AcrR family transcriptional regulator